MNNEKFGSLLKTNPDVLKQSQIYPTIDISLWWDEKTLYRDLPKFFDGRDAWQGFICFSAKQRCSDSWSIVARDVLVDRFALATGGQLVLQLSETDIISCINKSPRVTGSKNSCDGYSIYDAWEYIYANGLPQNNCFSHKKLQDLNLPMPETVEYSEKIKVYGKECTAIENNYTECIWKKNGIPIARRSFYADAILNMSQYDEKGVFDLGKSVETIKYELLRFGPVAAGFLVYENFVNDYDGTTIYRAVSGNPLGGHYVSIMGWNIDKDGTEYWICRNSYGTEWGLVGYFKMKIGITECMLEQNVSTVAPYFYDIFKTTYPIDGRINGKIVDEIDMKFINPTLYRLRKKLDIDTKTFYTKEILELIKAGKLYGDLEPLIENPEELLPDQRLFWVQNFKNFLFVTLEYEKTKDNTTNDNDHSFQLLLLLCLCLFSFYIGYKTR
jgi:hypothetical protein